MKSHEVAKHTMEYCIELYDECTDLHREAVRHEKKVGEIRDKIMTTLDNLQGHKRWIATYHRDLERLGKED